MRETVTIDFVYSRWNDPGKFGDPSNDIAIIRLAGESKTPSNMPEAIVPNRLTKQSRVSTIGFHTDIPGNTLLKRVYGYAIQPSSTAYLSAAVSKAGRPTWNIENIAVVSYDSGQGASGSPVLNAQGQIIGLHQGSHGRRGVEFDQFSSYNRAVTFDQRFADDLNAVLAECCRKSP